MDRTTRHLLIVVQVCFGIFPLLGKVAMGAFEPRALLVWRLFCGAGVLLGVALVRHGRAVWPGGRDLSILAGLSLLGVTFNQWLFLEGLHRSTAVNAGLVMTVIPIASTGLSVVLGRERATGWRLAGVGLAVLGVAWLFLGRGAAVGADTAFGDGLMLANAVSYSFYLVLAKPVLARRPPLVVAAWLFVFGALCAPLYTRSVDWVPAGARALHWWALAGVVVFPTVVAYVLNAWVLARVRVSVNATWHMLQPFVAAILGIVALGERPEPAVAVTGVCVLAGLWLVSSSGRNVSPAHPCPVPPSAGDPPDGRTPHR